MHWCWSLGKGNVSHPFVPVQCFPPTSWIPKFLRWHPYDPYGLTNSLVTWPPSPLVDCLGFSWRNVWFPLNQFIITSTGASRTQPHSVLHLKSQVPFALLMHDIYWNISYKHVHKNHSKIWACFSDAETGRPHFWRNPVTSQSLFVAEKTSPFLVVPSIYQHECEKPTTNVDQFNHFPRQTIEITTSAWFKTLNISLLRGNHHPASSTYFLGPHPSIVGLPVYEATQAVQVGPCCAESQWLTAIGLRELWNFESRCQGGALTRKTWDSMRFNGIERDLFIDLMVF